MVTKTAKQPVTAAIAELAYVELSKIDRSKSNPRQNFAGLESLETSLGEYGVLQPVLLRPSAGGRYELIAGERRFRAAQKADLKRIPALIKSISDQDAYLAQLAENLERRELNPLEKARGLAQLCAPVEEGGGGLTHTAAAAKFGHSQPWATNSIRILKLPPIWQRRIAEGEICEARARELLPFIESPNVMAEIERDYADPSSKPFYETWRGFKRQVELIASNHAAVSKRWRAPRSESIGRGVATNGSSPAAARTSAPITAKQSPAVAGPSASPAADFATTELDGSNLVALIRSQVMNLVDEEDLAAVEKAVADRRRQISGASQK